MRSGSSLLAALTATLLALVGCAQAPGERLSWREVLNLIVVDDGGTIVEAQLVHGNTGLLRGQAHLVVTLLPALESSVVFQRSLPPQAVTFDIEGGEIRMAQDRLVEHQGTWTLHLREGREALDATLHLTPRSDEIPPATLVPGQRQWILGAPVSHGEVTGAWRAGEQGDLVRGHGMLVRQSIDTWPGATPARSSLYLLGPQGSVGVESVGDATLAWVADEDGVRTGHTATIERRGRKLRLSLEPDLPVQATVRLARRSLVREPWEHLLPFERWFARLLRGWPLRTHERGQATLSIDGHESICPALFVHGQRPPASGRAARRARKQQAEE